MLDASSPDDALDPHVVRRIEERHCRLLPRHEAVDVARIAGVSAREIDAAATTVIDALSHPFMRRAAAISAGSLRREVPILLRRDDGTLAEGVVDLAFLEEGPDFAGWTVVDFKTDLEFESGRAEYSGSSLCGSNREGNKLNSKGNPFCYLACSNEPLTCSG